MKKAEKALKLEIGTILEILPSSQWYFDKGQWKLLKIRNEGNDLAAWPMFLIKNIDTGETTEVTHKFFVIK